MFNRDEETELFDDVTMDDCPICREMRDEWGVLDARPLDYLETRGITFPDPAALDDTQITETLWRMIHALAEIRIFLEMTNHLSDRELYEKLWSTDLREVIMFSPEDHNSASHLPMLSEGTGDDAWLRYYADERDREYWRTSFPDVIVPPHEEPPYARDAMLPSRWEAVAAKN